MKKSTHTVTVRHIAAGASFCGLIMAVSAVLFLWFPSLYLSFTYEDHVAEWMQVYFLVIAGALFLYISYRQRRYRLFFILMFLLCLYVVGEELSWGQRLLNVHVANIFLRHNLQQETNLHNFLIGPYDTNIKQYSEWLLALLLGGAAAYAHPVSSRFKIVDQWKQRLAPAPPVFLVSFFIAAAFLELGLLKINEAELAELFITFSVVVYALFCWDNCRGISVKRVGAIFIFVAILALLTTAAVYQVPHMRAKLDMRMAIGKKSFARRYCHLGLLPQSTALYLDLYSAKEKRAWLLRALAENYRLMGDIDGFKLYNNKAIALDQQHYTSHSNEVETNLSLFESYAQSKQREKAEFYLKRAVKIAASQIKSNPNDADAAYWLGQVYRIVGKKHLAIIQFKRAIELNPDGVTYRQALYRETQRK